VAVLHEHGPPANDGERAVLRLLRDELPDSWRIVSNFWAEQGKRQFECDALAVSDEGWAYLIETKAWWGRIRGNNKQWELPALTKEGSVTYRPNPVNQTHRNAQILKDVLRSDDETLSHIFVEPLVCIVSDQRPELEGSSADKVVLIDELIERVLTDPRTGGGHSPLDAPERVVDVLAHATKDIAPPTVLGPWNLEELVDQGENWELWRAKAVLGGDHSPDVRLKRYRLDSLATGEEARLQRERARRSLEALERLGDAEGVLPLLGAPVEIDDSFIVVTAWPRGESLGFLIESGDLEPEAAEELFRELARSVASVHAAQIVHRNITPDCAHLQPDGSVVLTDFDYSRLPDRSATGATVVGSGLNPEFAAPEVADDPSAATKASDVWSLARVGVSLFVASTGSVVPDGPLGAVPGHLRTIVAEALVVEPTKRPADAEVLLARLADRSSASPLFSGFEAYDVINDRYVVLPDAIGEGGTARVYHVDDTLHRQEYAAKFLKPGIEDQLDPDAEFLLLRDLPAHEGIVKPELLQRATTVRRERELIEYRGIFTLSPWIEGTRLDTLLLAGRMPRARAVEIALAVADAVVHLQRHEVVHRDVKPQNIIVGKDGVPRLVDFNVGRSLDGSADTQVGTPGYTPPDLSQEGWGMDSDPYALCVTLAEMLAGELLKGAVEAWLDNSAGLPESLVDLLRRGTASSRDKRFADGDDLVEALGAVLIDLQKPPAFEARAPFPEASEEDLARPNWNPYQYRLLTLFSQSRETNRGTRGVDDFDRWAYVPTRVDHELYADIRTGSFRLVIITGNAGDGKTAFIQMLQQRILDEGGAVVEQPNDNSTVIDYDGRKVITNLDGSQDEGDRSNDEVLSSFFAPFGGILPGPPEDETHVIAINEGRLIDFVSDQRDRFPALEQSVLGFVTEASLELPDWLLIVNLNLRALTIPDPGDPGDAGSGSITHEVLKRFADERLWRPCRRCAAFDDCYARANAEVLRSPILGPPVAERIRQTVDLVRLRRRMHVTMRDLRSALAYVVAGTRRCDEIVALAQSVDEPENARALLAGHLYNSLFAASERNEPPLRDPAATHDRLLRTIAAVDVARTANPTDDGRLWLDDESPLRDDPEGVQRTDRRLIDRLRAELPTGPETLVSVARRGEIAFLQGSLRRKLFLEREEPHWIEMLPYARLTQFQRQLVETLDEDRSALVQAISNSEGLYDDRFATELAVRLVPDAAGSERSFVSHSQEAFLLAPLDRKSAARYVEYEADSLRLVHRDHADIVLDLDLDLFETLMRIRDGNTPSREELRGAWLNLRVFKERLASLPADSLLLSRDGSTFYRVARTGSTTVAVEQTA
jgi:serine/threonine protein kinase